MTIEEQLKLVLDGDSALTALVGSRIGMGELQQGGEFPQVTYAVVSRVGTEQHGQTTDPYIMRVALRCAAYSNASVVAVRDAVHAVLIAFRSDGYPGAPTQFIGEYAMTDPYNTPKLRVRTLEYYVWTKVLE